jgi:hypothetical protein
MMRARYSPRDAVRLVCDRAGMAVRLVARIRLAARKLRARDIVVSPMLRLK